MKKGTTPLAVQGEIMLTKTRSLMKCRDDHDFHICVQKQRGNSAVVEALTRSPSVECCICGDRADDTVSVCKPVVLKK